jgi:50S ribosomal subunit-associated GTPase HflX
VVKDAEGKTKEVWISAAKGLGMDVLRAAVVECLASELMQGTLRLPVEADTAKLQAALFAAGAVVSHEIRESGDAWLHIALRQVKWSQLCHQFPELETYWQNETKGIQ